MPSADVPVQQYAGPFHSSVILLLKLLMQVGVKQTTVQFRIGLLGPLGSFPPKFMNSGRACQLWMRQLWQKQSYETDQKWTEVIPLVWWMYLNKSLPPLEAGQLEEVWREDMRNLSVTRYGSRVSGPGGREGSRLHPSASPTSVLPSSHFTEAHWPQSVTRSSAQIFHLSTGVRVRSNLTGGNRTGTEETYKARLENSPSNGLQIAKGISIPEDWILCWKDLLPLQLPSD